MDTVKCNKCGGKGFFANGGDCHQCKGTGEMTLQKIEEGIAYWNLKLANGVISEDEHTRHLSRLRRQQDSLNDVARRRTIHPMVELPEPSDADTPLYWDWGLSAVNYMNSVHPKKYQVDLNSQINTINKALTEKRMPWKIGLISTTKK